MQVSWASVLFLRESSSANVAWSRLSSARSSLYRRDHHWRVRNRSRRWGGFLWPILPRHPLSRFRLSARQPARFRRRAPDLRARTAAVRARLGPHLLRLQPSNLWGVGTFVGRFSPTF